MISILVNIINMATTILEPLFSNAFGARFVFYPTVLYGVLKNSPQRRWFDRIDEKVILGALPFPSVAKRLVEKENVGHVITLNEKYETRFLCPSEKKWSELGVKQLCIPTVDFNTPSLEMIDAALEFIENVKDSKSIYIHCKAGRSRSAVVTLCYVMKSHSMNVDESIELVKSKRPHIALGKKHMTTLLDYYNKRIK